MVGNIWVVDWSYRRRSSGGKLHSQGRSCIGIVEVKPVGGAGSTFFFIDVSGKDTRNGTFPDAELVAKSLSLE